jgi:hypothetical protein
MTAVIDTGGLADCLIGLYGGKTGKTDKFFGILHSLEGDTEETRSFC